MTSIVHDNGFNVLGLTFLNQCFKSIRVVKLQNVILVPPPEWRGCKPNAASFPEVLESLTIFSDLPGAPS
jgi:hypothetical protein